MAANGRGGLDNQLFMQPNIHRRQPNLHTALMPDHDLLIQTNFDTIPGGTEYPQTRVQNHHYQLPKGSYLHPHSEISVPDEPQRLPSSDLDSILPPPQVIYTETNSVTNPLFTQDFVWNTKTDTKSANPASATRHVPQHYARHQRESGRQRVTKEKQRRATRQHVDAVLDQRPNRCLHCRLHPGNRGCFDYPICERCTLHHIGCSSLTHPTDWQFLDWRYLLTVCQELCEESRAHPALNAASISATDTLNSASVAVILEFTFYDKLQNNVCSPHVVVFRPYEQSLRAYGHSNPGPVSPRAPALDRAQLDDLVRKELWGLSLWNSDGTDLPPDELHLWTAVRLFIGYFAMMHNISTTFIQASDLATTGILGRVSAELFYAIGFRLQMLYFEIMSFQSQQGVSNTYSRTISAVKLYSYELMYRLLNSMQNTDWNVSSQPTHHPLHQLEVYFNQRVKHILCQLASSECRDSGILTKNRRMKPPPAMIEFARSLPSTSFPRCCIVTVSQHRNYLPTSVPCSWEVGARYRSVDAVGARCEDLLSGLRNSTQEGSLLSEFVSTNNIVVQHDKLLSQTPKALGLATSISNELDSDTGGADSYVSDLAARLDTFREDYETGPIISNPESPEVGGLPSLGTPGTPFSIFSPTTPTSITTTMGYEAF